MKRAALPCFILLAIWCTPAAQAQNCPLGQQASTTSGPLTMSAAYSWDTHQASLAIRGVFTAGTCVLPATDSLTLQLQRPDGSNSGLTITASAGNAPDTYQAHPYVGLAPMLGVWIASVDAPRTGGGRETAATTFLIPQDEALLFADQKALLLDLWRAHNASFEATWNLINTARSETNRSFETTWNLINQSRAEDNESFRYSWKLLNDTLAGFNATTPEPADLDVTFTGDGPNLIYAGRSARIEGNASNTTRLPWYWTWDYGDNTTGEGIVTYHAWDRPGAYNVTARATNALGKWSTTNLTVMVRLSTPILNITGPRELKLGETGEWTTGTSHDPYDDAAFTFVSDPRKVNVWLLGERWMNSGYCGPLNATSLRAPDEAGIQIPFLQAQWEIHRATTCTSFQTAWGHSGEHHVVLYGVNKHGVLVSLDYVVHVGDLRERVAPAPHRSGAPVVEPIDFRPVVDETRDSINGFLDFIKWITGG